MSQFNQCHKNVWIYYYYYIIYDNTCDSSMIKLMKWYLLNACSQLFRRLKDFQVKK